MPDLFFSCLILQKDDFGAFTRDERDLGVCGWSYNGMRNIRYTTANEG